VFVVTLVQHLAVLLNEQKEVNYKGERNRRREKEEE
jgi:hypothetical protein